MVCNKGYLKWNYLSRLHYTLQQFSNLAPFLLRPLPKITRWNLRKPQSMQKLPAPNCWTTYLHRILASAVSSVLGVVVTQGLYFRDVGEEAPYGNYISQEAVCALLRLCRRRAPPRPAPPSLGCHCSRLPVSPTCEKFTLISWSQLTTGEEEALEAAKEAGGRRWRWGWIHRCPEEQPPSPAAPRGTPTSFATAELLRGGVPGLPRSGREGHGPRLGER